VNYSHKILARKQAAAAKALKAAKRKVKRLEEKIGK